MSDVHFWFHHATISVPNLDESVGWWHDKLGFEVEHRGPLSVTDGERALMSNGELRVELVRVAGASAPEEARTIPDTDVHTYGNKHVSFACEDAPSLADTLRERGVDIVWVKKHAGGGNCYLRDNSGALVEFVSQPKPDKAFADFGNGRTIG